MKKPSLYNIGSCFSFRFWVNNDFDYERFYQECIDKRISVFMFDDDIANSEERKSITVLLFGTFIRKAYDLYQDFHGSEMRVLDPVTIQALLMGIGVYECNKPFIYRMSCDSIISWNEDIKNYERGISDECSYYGNG